MVWIMVAFTNDVYVEIGDIIVMLAVGLNERLQTCELKVTPKAIQAVVQECINALDGSNIAA